MSVPDGGSEVPLAHTLEVGELSKQVRDSLVTWTAFGGFLNAVSKGNDLFGVGLVDARPVHDLGVLLKELRVGECAGVGQEDDLILDSFLLALHLRGLSLDELLDKRTLALGGQTVELPTNVLG